MKLLLLFCLAYCCTPLIGQNLDQLQQYYNNYNQANAQEKVYVETDRTLYKPNDNIWFSAFVTDGANHPSLLSDLIFVELYSPKGDLVEELKLSNQGGQASGNFKISPLSVGGIYKLRAYSYWMQNFSEDFYFEKKITVQQVVIPNVLMELDFEKEAYGAGDQVVATFKARSKDNQPLSNKNLLYTIQINGETITESEAVTNEEGIAIISYQLPEKLSTANNLLNIQFKEDGLTESIARSAPIVFNNLAIQLLPEGGNLVVNQKNRIALKVLNEFGQPADIKGQIVDEKGTVITSVETYHQGMGAVELTPKAGEQYILKVTTPVGITEEWTLPKAVDDKIGLYLKEQTQEQLDFAVYAHSNQVIDVVAQQQGTIVATQSISAQKGENQLNLDIKNWPMGIVQVTVFDAQQRPHAERLVFVHKERPLNISIKSNKESYQPREKVRLDIKVTDELGKAVVGNFSLAVVDDKQHTFIDDKQDNILSYLLMSSELKGAVYEPNFYFDPAEEKADKALDYVLLTHGWRRFDWNKIVTEDAITALEYPLNQREISGFLQVGNEYIKNQTIFLSEGQARYTKKKALAVAQTDEHGFFKFKVSEVKFPAYISANYHGVYRSITVHNYSKANLKGEKIAAYLVEEQNNLRYNTSPHKYTSRYVNTGSTSIKGKIIDGANDEGLPFASIELRKDGNPVGTVTDFDGNFEITSLEDGIYDLTAYYVGFRSFMTKVRIHDGHTLIATITMNEEEAMMAELIVVKDEVTDVKADKLRLDRSKVKEKKVDELGKMVEKAKAAEDKTAALKNELYIEPNGNILGQNVPDILSQDAIAGGQTLTAADIQNLAVRNVNSIVATTAGVSQSSSYNNSNRYNVNSGAFDDINNFRSTANLELKQLLPEYEQYNIVRQFYAPNYQKAQNPDKRTDFRKTIYWNPSIKTDNSGQANVTYYNSDEVTTFRVIVAGHGKTGKVGHQEQTYSSNLPFSITTKIPTTLSFGDTVHIPVVLKNTTSKALEGAFLASVPTQLSILESTPEKVLIEADSHTVVYLKCKVLFEIGKGFLETSFEAKGLKDAVKEIVRVIPKGFPVNFSMAGQVLNQVDTFDLNGAYDGSINSILKVYSTMLDGLMDGVDGILRQPSGCFEQVSSSNYPNILALKLMEQTGTINSEIRKRALDYLKTGYAKLAGYEVKGGGFDWWGKAPAHEGLTAYGLVQFNDMKAVYDGVEDDLIERTKAFLLKQRKGNGHYDLNPHSLHKWSNASILESYITWALTEVGGIELEKEIATMTEEAIKSEDLYRLSLVALMHLNVGNTKEGEDLVNTITAIIKKVGVDKVTAESTVTYSYGNALNIETLSYAALAIMRSKNADKVLLQAIAEHLLSKRSYGRFGSTQSTVMALKALSTYQEYSNQFKESGTLEVYVNNALVKSIPYSKDTKQQMVINDVHKAFKEGQNTIQVQFKGVKEALPYSFDANWTADMPTKHSACPLTLATNLKNTQTAVGATVRMDIAVENILNKSLPSTMAVVGIPAGLSVQPWQLKSLQEQEAFAFYEIKENYLVLYYRYFEEKEKKTLALDLKTEVPGYYNAPASTTYLYYGDEYKYWTAGTTVEIEP